MRGLIWLFASVAMGYVLIVAALYFWQRDILYQPPRTARIAPAQAGFPQAEEIELATDDGERIIAWHVTSRNTRPVVVFFHGNAEALEFRVPRFREIVADGNGLLAVSFRGYAGSSGHPTEDGLLRDAKAAYSFAAARYPTQRIALWGYSLGSGPAVVTAAAFPVGKLILEAPFTSAVDVAALAYPLMPVRWLMKDQFRSDQHIGKVRAPILILHGERDHVVPFRLGRELFASAPEPKRFVAFPQATHVDLDSFGVTAAARAFLDE